MEKPRNELILPELYFLIQKFLSNSPLQETYKVLCNEIERNKILPNRLDWEGYAHERSFEDLKRLYPHIANDHLLQICNRIGPILDKEIPPSLKGVACLLGYGRQSLLRTNESISQRKTTSLYYATRIRRMPLRVDYRTTHNLVNVLFGRETSGPCPRSLLMPCERYGQLKLHRQTLGHLSSVYCLMFDHSGRYIVTGADDLLIKLWSCTTGRLLASFRGATGEITDIDINTENNLLAAGSMDRILRVWNLQTGAPIATLTCHTGMITSVNFCPSSMWDIRYLVTTSTDGSVAFWTYSHDSRNNVHFVLKPVLFHEKMRPGQAQMICSVFSPGGSFLASGSADHNVRVYLLRGDEGPVRILETEVHTDRVDSLSWAHRGLRFLSGSKDGTAHIWHFETQQWKSKKLDMTTRLPGHLSDDEPKKPTRVTMVAWDCSDTFVITAVSDFTLKVWFSSTGQLHLDLLHHKNEIYVLESHPTDPYIILSAGHDGLICVWNILTGNRLVEFINHVENQGVGEVYDAKWNSDGSRVAASDAYGHILIFGFDCGDPRLKLLPKEVFFHTDYRPLVHDPERGVLDEQTQIPPHLMPPPFLVDIDGNPYPPMLQRLVPGRENCTSEQLVPNIVFGTGGRQEVIEGLPDGDHPRSDIDRLIEDIARRHNPQPDNAPRAPAVRQGHRRSGDVEGVRQSTGDWQSGSNIEWTKNSYIKSISLNEEQYFKEHVDFLCNLEMDEYKSEMKRRPIMISSTPQTSKLDSKGRRRRANGRQYTTARRSMRSIREEEPEEQDPEESANDQSTSSHHSDYSSTHPDSNSSSSSSDESSGYSDWVADQGQVNLQPPKRSKRKSAHRKMGMSDSEEEKEPNVVEEEQEETMNESDDNNEKKEEVKGKRPMNRKKKSASTLVVNGFAEASTNKQKVQQAPKNVKRILKNGEIPELYKPSEWLAETVPRKAPYWPQMGDEVVYFVQGHQIYVESVKAKNIYSVNTKELPWTKHDLKDHEYVKIVGIKYEIRPPRLCCLKLALLDEDMKLTDKDFTIKYHDMADVLDFMILSQTYDLAISRVWNPGDRFRCMIEDAWWMGKIVKKSALNEDYPDSLFSYYETQWDSGELERMSPWDMEIINDERLPEMPGDALPILPSELQSLLYTPSLEEWPNNADRESFSARIIAGLDYIMGLAIAEPFLAPVDLNIYPAYACIVEYPIDLTTIKVRLENRFYRRVTSVQFDIRYLATNAEKFNKPHSCIVKFARIITEICLRLMSSTEDIELPTLYHQLMETYESSGSDEDNDANDASYNAHDDANSDEDIDVVNAGAGPSTRPSTSKATRAVLMNGEQGHASNHNGNSSTVLRSLRSARLKYSGPSGSTSAIGGVANESDSEFASGAAVARNIRYSTDWRLEAKRLLDKLWQSEDSTPFRAPVDHLKHPDYYQLIDTPIDLGSIKEDLFGGNYESPLDFAKDVRLVFTNSKRYNTNSRSRIYSMTNRLSIKFEKYIKSVIAVWRRGKRANINPKKNRKKQAPKRRCLKKQLTSNNDTTTEEESLPEEEEDEEEEEKEEVQNVGNENNENDQDSDERQSLDGQDNEEKVQIQVEVHQAQDQEQFDVDPLKDMTPEEEDNVSIRLNGLNRNVIASNKRLQMTSQSSDSDDDGSSFSDSEKVPLSQGRIIVSSVLTTDDSDSQPLSQLRGRNNKAHSNSHRRKGTLRIHSSNSSDSSKHSNYSANLRRKCKRIKLSLSDSEEMTDATTSNMNTNTATSVNSDSGNSDNSDSMPLNVLRQREASVTQSQSSQSQSNNDEDDIVGEPQVLSNDSDHNYGRPGQRQQQIVSVSSRGRIRKITERARALFR